MPGPLVIPAIMAGTQLANTAMNVFSQGKTNKKTRKWNEKMYDRQRADSLADFTMQNQYNSPEEQMKRLKMAGLNPNLVYGNGATSEAGPIRSTDMKSWNPQAPQVDLQAAPVLNSYYDSQIKKQTIDNLKAQNNVIVQESALKVAQTMLASASAGSAAQQTAKSSFDLHLAEDLRKTTLQAAQANLDKTMADTKTTLDENERRQALQASNLQQAAENILNARAARAKTNAEREQIRTQIDNLKQDNRLKQLDIDLKKNGIQPGDAIYWRVLGRLLSGGDIKSGIDSLTK